MSPTTVNHLVLGGPLPTQVVLLLGAVLFGLNARTLWRSLGRPYGRILAALRALSTLLVVVLCLQPQWAQDELLRPKEHIGVVVDRSGSMALPRGGGPAPAEGAEAWLQQAQAQALRQDAQRTLSVHTLGSAEASHLAQDLITLLRRSEAQDGQAIDGVVLLSDGIDTGGAQNGAHALDATLAQTLAGFDVPISTVAWGTSPKVLDVAITAVRHDAYAFVKNTMNVGVELLAAGYPEGTQAVVRLRQNGTEVDSQRVSFASGHAITELHVVPTTIGEAAYTVSVDPQANEATLLNNTSHFVARVVRDKIRVLHVAGRPSWDQRFVREALKARAQVDLISFYILRTPFSDNTIPESELALIPFPVDRLFTTELKNFDVVLFQNFDFRPFRMEGYLPNIAHAIDQGLGFMMLGGADSFGQGGYAGTALEPRLPTLAGSSHLMQAPAAAHVTPQGRHHPLMALCQDAREGPGCVPGLPKLNRINALGALQPGATVLAQTDAATGSVPLLVARDVGLGRTLALATDTLWHWRVHDGAASAAAKAYDRFWGQALLWLTHDPATAPLQVLPRKQQLGPHQAMQVTVALMQAADPAKGQPTVSLQLLAHTASGAAAVSAEQAQQVDAVGQAHFEVAGVPEGIYSLVARARGASDEARALVVVQPQGTELQDITARPELLAHIAGVTGGRVFAALPLKAGDAIAQAPVSRRKEPIVVGRKSTPLWDRASVGAALLGLLGLEWLMRRRLGLA